MCTVCVPACASTIAIHNLPNKKVFNFSGLTVINFSYAL